MLARMSDLSIRRARATDVELITAIYNQGIEDRVATLETELRTPDERRAWLAARGDRHPVLVAERDARVLAWASLNSFNPRVAYAHVADLSIYVSPRGARHRGGGGSCFHASSTRLGAYRLSRDGARRVSDARPGMRLYARWASPRWAPTASRACLDGRWVDVIVMEQILG